GNFILRLNSEFAFAAQRNASLHINDVHYLSSMTGLQEWFDHSFWCMYKYALSFKAIPLFCHNIATIIGAAHGKSKKLLVLDLDNTLWGGVIGDDGVGGIRIGKDDPQGEAFTRFQLYIKALRERGIMLAICSKNDIESAREGLSHPDMILKEEDFVAMRTTWGPKDISIREIANELNIGVDSIVFVDDNPVERELVKGNLPEVAVPDIGEDVTRFASIIDQAGYFDTVSLSKDDLDRNEYYVQNSKRATSEAKFATHGEYLQSLEMVAEIADWCPFYLERIVQLINKTNQFNLTVKRLAQTEAENSLKSDKFISLYGKLADKFGDNGLVSVLQGRIDDQKAIHIDLWVMSCRVFNRELELAMFDMLVDKCINRGITTIYGTYIPSTKNRLVADLYASIGFNMVGESETGKTLWEFKPTKDYKRLTGKIDIRGV
ncbi:MAG TPA: HAD-IIIC family phosphatase, partial [Chitinispirillaceae bacterium]|nr:HAD-IIIC family phosphatase [Chitinispirillaceae bacterium]